MLKLSALDPGKQGLKPHLFNISHVSESTLSALDPGKQGLKRGSRKARGIQEGAFSA